MGRDRDAGHIDLNLDDPDWSLREWKRTIDDLIVKYGEDAILFTDAGYNNVELFLQIPTPKKKGK
jgi:hypothetical protein